MHRGWQPRPPCLGVWSPNWRRTCGLPAFASLPKSSLRPALGHPVGRWDLPCPLCSAGRSSSISTSRLTAQPPALAPGLLPSELARGCSPSCLSFPGEGGGCLSTGWSDRGAHPVETPVATRRPRNGLIFWPLLVPPVHLPFGGFTLFSCSSQPKCHLPGEAFWSPVCSLGVPQSGGVVLPFGAHVPVDSDTFLSVVRQLASPLLDSKLTELLRGPGSRAKRRGVVLIDCQLVYVAPLRSYTCRHAG